MNYKISKQLKNLAYSNCTREELLYNYREIINKIKNYNYNSELIKKQSYSFKYRNSNYYQEVWLEFPFNNNFLLSSLGRVKYNMAKNKWIILKQIIRNKDLYLDNSSINHFDNWLITEVPIKKSMINTFLNKYTNGYIVHHINNNRLDNRIINLNLLTPYEHYYVHGYEKKDINTKTVFNPEEIFHFKD